MAEIMMQLGDFQFGLDTAAYQEFQRTTAYNWASQARFGMDDALQSTGPGADTISLPGIIYPQFRGGLGQIDDMRAQAGKFIQQPMIDGRGTMLGDWVIEGIEERGAVFGPAGVALRQEFTIRLRRFPAAPKSGFLEVAASEVSQILPVTSDLITSSITLAQTADNAAGGLVGTLNAALSTVTGYAAELGAYASTVNGAVQQGINVARRLQNAGADAGKLLASVKNISNLPSALNSLVMVSGDVSRAAGIESSILKSAGIDLTAISADVNAIKAVRDSMISVNQVNVLAVTVRNTAVSIIKKVGA